MSDHKKHKHSKQTISHRMNRLVAVLEETGYDSGANLSTDGNHLLFDAGERLLFLRIVSAVALACPAVCIVLVTRMHPEQMIHDLGSVMWGRVLQIALVLLSSVYFFVLLWLSNKYVLRMELSGGKIQIQTWRVLLPAKKIVLPVNAFSNTVEYHRGRLALPFRPIVDAPYHKLRAGQHTFLIDDQGNFPLGFDTMMETVHQ